MKLHAHRSTFLAAAALLAMAVGLSMAAEDKVAQTQPAGETKAIRLNSREVFFPCPRDGVRVEGQSFYTRKEGVEKMRFRAEQTKSDKMDAMEWSFSEDNGKTWGEPKAVTVVKKTDAGVERTGWKAGWVDPVNGRLLFMTGGGVTTTDIPLDGLSRGRLSYAVSIDGGHTFAVNERIIQKGEGYSDDHPLEGIWFGKNGASYGDRVGRPIRTRKGNILQPVQVTLPGEHGKPANPGGGFTYTEAAVLIGTWADEKDPDNNKIDWQISRRVANDPTKSSRGAIEPTIAELPDGRILMVMRGSDTKTTPGYKWFSLSDDGGFTWGPIKQWTYSDGAAFYSPSSCSQLLPHSNGHLYWLGNIPPIAPKGNLPRYPFVIGEVDLATGLLIKSSVVVVDTKRGDDDKRVMLSNFMAHEDRQTHEILLHMSRPFAKEEWTTDAYLYRIEVGK